VKVLFLDKKTRNRHEPERLNNKKEGVYTLRAIVRSYQTEQVEGSSYIKGGDTKFPCGGETLSFGDNRETQNTAAAKGVL